jgi:two-component sensor histidine kinase
MTLHELATNAAKYGALSMPGGRIDVSWWRLDPAGGGLRLRWDEQGGPPIPAPPEHRGFGSTLIEATVRGQLGGGAAFAWRPKGLLCEIDVAADRLEGSTPGPAGAAPAGTPDAPRAATPAPAPGGTVAATPGRL